jgi:hypothetical protein
MYFVSDPRITPYLGEHAIIKNYPPLCTFVFLFVFLLVGSCDNQLTQPEPSAADQVLVPEYGDTPLP